MNRRFGLCYVLLNFKAGDKYDVYYLSLCPKELQGCRQRFMASCVGKPDCVTCLKYQLMGFRFHSIVWAICTIVICLLVSFIVMYMREDPVALFHKY